MNPAWNRDELIVALDAYVMWNGNPPAKSSDAIEGLSALLNDLHRAIVGRGFNGLPIRTCAGCQPRPSSSPYQEQSRVATLAVNSRAYRRRPRRSPQPPLFPCQPTLSIRLLWSTTISRLQKKPPSPWPEGFPVFQV